MTALFAIAETTDGPPPYERVGASAIAQSSSDFGAAHTASSFIVGGVSFIIGDIVLAPKSQAYYWTEAWQIGERVADEDIAAGRVTRFESMSAAIDSLHVDRD